MWRILSLGPKGMEIARKFIQIEGNSMRLVGHCGGLNEARIKGNAPHQREFRGIIKCVIKPRGSREHLDRKSTRLNSSHLGISYAVFCLKKKTSIDQVPSAM